MKKLAENVAIAAAMGMGYALTIWGVGYLVESLDEIKAKIKTKKKSKNIEIDLKDFELEEGC